VRDTSRPVPFARAARAVFSLSVEGMLWSRRSLVIGVLLAIPVLIAVLYRVVLVTHLPPRVTSLGLYAGLINGFWLRNALPLAALFYAAALIADEVEGRTLTYLLTRPVHRVAILAGKFGAYLATTLCLSLPAVVLTFFILATAKGARLSVAAPGFARDLAVLSLTLVVYGALFLLLGVLLRRPLIVGLAYVFVWEFFIPNAPGYVPRFTLTTWLRSLLTGGGVSNVFGGQVLPTGLSLVVLALATVAFLALAAWIFSRREYVLDQ